jgi:hypothetical protein
MIGRNLYFNTEENKKLSLNNSNVEGYCIFGYDGIGW